MGCEDLTYNVEIQVVNQKHMFGYCIGIQRDADCQCCLIVLLCIMFGLFW